MTDVEHIPTEAEYWPGMLEGAENTLLAMEALVADLRASRAEAAEVVQLRAEVASLRAEAHIADEVGVWYARWVKEGEAGLRSSRPCGATTVDLGMDPVPCDEPGRRQELPNGQAYVICDRHVEVFTRAISGHQRQGEVGER